MLQWFEVENFKSIKKLHLDFSPFMVLIGPNGAGKTNIVQAVSLLLDIVAAGSTEPVVLYGGYEQLILRRKQSARNGLRLALCCPLSGSLVPIIPRGSAEPPLILHLDLVLRPLPDTELPVIWRERIVLVQGDETPFSYAFSLNKLEEMEFGSSETVKKLLGYWNNNLSKKHIEARFSDHEPTSLKFPQMFPVRLMRHLPGAMRLRLDSSSLRGDSLLGSARARRVLGLSGEGLPLAIERMKRPKSPDHAIFERILSKLQNVYPRIEDVSTVHYQPGRVALSFQERKIDGELGEANVSDGVIHALALLVAMYRTSQSDLLIIEEPENALHPWALQRIIADAQDSIHRFEPLLLTTHSPVVVNAVKQPESLFVVENHEDKGTLVFPALEKEHALKVILSESGQKLGDVWLDGTLGGVPGVES